MVNDYIQGVGAQIGRRGGSFGISLHDFFRLRLPLDYWVTYYFPVCDIVSTPCRQDVKPEQFSFTMDIPENVPTVSLYITKFKHINSCVWVCN